METDVGEISIHAKRVKWIIHNFWDLPQEYDTIIRSPHFRFEGRDWCIEVYPNGRSLYSSLGWFEISVRNLDSDSIFLNSEVSVVGELLDKNILAFITNPDGAGSYYYTRLFPASLLKSWKDVVAPRGTFHLEFNTVNEGNEDSVNVLVMLVETKYGK